MSLTRFISLTVFWLLIVNVIHSQDPLRFKKEIDTINKKYISREGTSDLILFTGSSSVRRWENVQGYFPEKNIINTGFGGSQMSDLLWFADKVIFRYKPIQLFIYEGDNDLAAGEKPDDIIREADSLIRMIHKRLPQTEVVIISAKPSPLRWKLKDEYLKLNAMFSKLDSEFDYVRYIDLWTPLIGPSGSPVSEYYIKDSLHINSSGYDKWAAIVGKVLK
jgi:lysophospholipase L1-like esterase